MNVMNELLPTLDLPYIKLILNYKVFEDNKLTITLTKTSSMLPSYKHISLKCHYFRKFILNNSINIEYICTEEEI